MHLRLIIGSVLAICLSFAGGVASAATNLVPNGNFEGGNTQFTSDYALSGSNTTEGQYAVLSNPFPWNGAFVSIGDHTSGTGLMMVVNGSPDSGAVVWRSQSIAVGAATNYFFEAFVNNVCCQGGSPFGPGSESILEFSLSFNGNLPISLGTITTNLALAGTWEGLSTQFLSSGAGSVVLSLINRNIQRGGNDFAIDDVFFGTQSIVNPTNPVPEPETYAMLLAGLGLLGFAARRRKQQAA